MKARAVRVFRGDADQGLHAALNQLLSDALRAGSRTLLVIDPEAVFDPFDALRALARTEPVLVAAGPGRHADGSYPVSRVGTGFLRLRTEVLERMIASHGLPFLRDRSGRGSWPFFEAATVTAAGGCQIHLTPEEAFTARLLRLGVTPLADASLKAWRPPPGDGFAG